MAKRLHCKDVGFECGFVAEAETENELLEQVAAHAQHEHGISEITPELVNQVKAQIRSD